MSVWFENITVEMENMHFLSRSPDFFIPIGQRLQGMLLRIIFYTWSNTPRRLEKHWQNPFCVMCFDTRGCGQHLWSVTLVESFTKYDKSACC